MIYQRPLAYLLGLEGVALLRAFAGEYDRDFTDARIAEMERGHRVIGVDSSPDMLARARERVHGAEFRLGDLHQLPVPDDHVDIVLCALALTHVPDLKPVFAEFVRVLRPGGHLVTADVHHELITLGSVPRIRSADGEPRLPPAYLHRTGDYLNAALPLGLSVRRCDESRMQVNADGPSPDDDIDTGPWDFWPWSLFDVVPAARSAAFNGTPATIIWHFQLADR